MASEGRKETLFQVELILIQDSLDFLYPQKSITRKKGETLCFCKIIKQTLWVYCSL